jgi:hypothetical protein
MSPQARVCALALVSCMSVLSACGDDPKHAAPDPVDASTGDDADAAVPYRGPTRGGRLPDDPAYVEPAPDDGPFDAAVACCQQTLGFAALPNETALTIEADSAPLDGAQASLDGDRFTLALCMPLGVAIQYRLRTMVDTDAGAEEVVRVDAEQPSLEDESGEAWNLFVQQACK